MALPSMTGSGTKPRLPTGTTALAQNRQIRQGDYIITYSPEGRILSRVYSPLPGSTSTPTVSNRIGGSTGTAATTQSSAGMVTSVPRTNAGQLTRTANSVSTSRQYGSTGNTAGTRQLGTGSSGSSYGTTNYGGGDTVGAYDNIGGDQSIGNGSGGSMATGNNSNTQTDTTLWNGPYKNMSGQDIAALDANPLGHLKYAFGGMDPLANPIFASIMTPYINAVQNPYFALMLNPGLSGADTGGYGNVFSKDTQYNATNNLLRKMAAPGGGYLSLNTGLNALAQGLANPNSAIAQLFQSTLGSDDGIMAQYNLMRDLLAPFLSLGMGKQQQGIMGALLDNLYNRYTLGSTRGGNQNAEGVTNKDFIEFAMQQLGYPGATLGSPTAP